MRERKSFKGIMLAMTAAIMMLMFTVPVSAATGITKLATGGFAISKGTCVHLLNANISGNGISSYTYRITPLAAGTKYDIVYAYGGTVKALRSCHTDSGDVTNATYFKSTSQSNVGLIACLKVTSGSVKVTARITASNPKARMGLQQITSASHNPLKRTNAIKKGYYIEMTGVGSNINEFPVIMAGKSGARVDRRLSVARKAYEAYDFRNSYMIFRSYSNNKLTRKLNLNYGTADGSMRYYFMRIPRNSNGNAYTGKMYTKKGSARYYYPSDYIKVKGSVRKYK